jgi:hypothetical protein
MTPVKFKDPPATSKRFSNVNPGAASSNGSTYRVGWSAGGVWKVRR